MAASSESVLDHRPLEVAPDAPARFFMQALGMDPENAPRFSLPEGYGLAPVPPSPSMDRVHALLDPSFVPARPLTQVPGAWILTRENIPLGLLTQAGAGDFGFIEFSHHLAIENPDDQAAKIRENWLRFRDQGLLAEWSRKITPEMAHDGIRVHERHTDGFSLYWTNFRTTLFGPEKFPGFLDVFRPDNALCIGADRCGRSAGEGRREDPRHRFGHGAGSHFSGAKPQCPGG